MVLRGPVRRERTFPRPLHRHHQPEMLTHGFMLLTQISDPAAEIEVRQTTVRFGRVCSCSRRTGVESDVVVFCFRSSCVPVMLFRTPRCVTVSSMSARTVPEKKCSPATLFENRRVRGNPRRSVVSEILVPARPAPVWSHCRHVDNRVNGRGRQRSY